MSDDIRATKSGMLIMLRWSLLAKWGWHIGYMLLALLFGAHVVMTNRGQEKQDERLTRIEKVLEKCALKCEGAK